MPDEESKKIARKRNRRGGGSLFQKTEGGKWHIQYYFPETDPVTGKAKSKRVREYCTLPKTAAQKLLNDRLGKIGRGEPVAGCLPVTVAELYIALQTFTKSNSTSSRGLKGIGWRWDHLRPYFGGMRASEVSTASIEKYKHLRREEEKAAPATVNRELATLRRMFNYGKRSTPPRVFAAPHIQMFPENNARKGFVEQADFERMAEEAHWDGLWMQTYIELAYTYGWRRGELLALQVRQVNLTTRTIRLDTGTTKNGEGREVAMTAKVAGLLRKAVQDKKPNDSVFTREDFRGAWRNLCLRAGTSHWECSTCGANVVEAKCECGGARKYVGLIPHDFRRSAAKALRRAGVPESVIMATGGWKTASMFRRYAIVSTADQRDAMALLELARERERVEKPISPPTGPFDDFAELASDEQERPVVQ
jgi:integrase